MQLYSFYAYKILCQFLKRNVSTLTCDFATHGKAQKVVYLTVVCNAWQLFLYFYI